MGKGDFLHFSSGMEQLFLRMLKELREKKETQFDEYEIQRKLYSIAYAQSRIATVLNCKLACVNLYFFDKSFRRKYPERCYSYGRGHTTGFITSDHSDYSFRKEYVGNVINPIITGWNYRRTMFLTKPITSKRIG